MQHGSVNQSSYQLETLPGTQGFYISELLALPATLRNLLTNLLRLGVFNPEEMAEVCGTDTPTTSLLLETLIEKGYVRKARARTWSRYRVWLLSRPVRRLQLDVWHSGPVE